MVLSIEYKTSNFFYADVGADVLDLAETMVASADGLVYEPVSLIHISFSVVCFEEFFSWKQFWYLIFWYLISFVWASFLKIHFLNSEVMYDSVNQLYFNKKIKQESKSDTYPL